MKTNTTAPVRQKLAPIAEKDKMVKFTASSGGVVELSAALTKMYFCPAATELECVVFNNWCAHNGLDPWKREAYLVKYGTEPAKFITAKDALTKRAAQNPLYKGQKAGVVVINRDGELENRVGELVLPNEELVGGWADVFVDGYVCPISASISFHERCQYKDGKPMAKWATSPALMIRKCALAAALREAFPGDVGNMYIPDEMGVDEEDVPDEPIEHPAQNVQDVEYSDVVSSENDSLEMTFFDGEEPV